MRKSILSFLLISILPGLCFGASAKYTSLVREKQRKMAELEKCTGSTKGLKIAGLSTLGLTAVGIAGNIAEAGKIKDYDSQIARVDKKIDSANYHIEQNREKLANINNTNITVKPKPLTKKDQQEPEYEPNNECEEYALDYVKGNYSQRLKALESETDSNKIESYITDFENEIKTIIQDPENQSCMTPEFRNTLNSYKTKFDTEVSKKLQALSSKEVTAENNQPQKECTEQQRSDIRVKYTNIRLPFTTTITNCETFDNNGCITSDNKTIVMDTFKNELKQKLDAEIVPSECKDKVIYDKNLALRELQEYYDEQKKKKTTSSQVASAKAYHTPCSDEDFRTSQWTKNASAGWYDRYGKCVAQKCKNGFDLARNPNTGWSNGYCIAK